MENKEIKKNISDEEAIKQEAEKKKKQEQERTKRKKKLFLDIYERSMGIITVGCQKAEIHRRTFYLWKETDPEFVKKLSEVAAQRNDEVEDGLFRKIKEQDGSSIRFYLERKHPAYKAKNTTEVIVGEKTLEDLIDDDEEKLNEEKLNKKNNGEKKEDKQMDDRKSAQDKKQEGNSSAVQIKPSAKPVLEQKDKAQLDNQSEAKRTE